MTRVVEREKLVREIWRNREREKYKKREQQRERDIYRLNLRERCALFTHGNGRLKLLSFVVFQTLFVTMAENGCTKINVQLGQ